MSGGKFLFSVQGSSVTTICELSNRSQGTGNLLNVLVALYNQQPTKAGLNYRVLNEICD